MKKRREQIFTCTYFCTVPQTDKMDGRIIEGFNKPRAGVSQNIL